MTNFIIVLELEVINGFDQQKLNDHNFGLIPKQITCQNLRQALNNFDEIYKRQTGSLLVNEACL